MLSKNKAPIANVIWKTHSIKTVEMHQVGINPRLVAL